MKWGVASLGLVTRHSGSLFWFFFKCFFIFITVRLVKWNVASLGLETQRTVVIWFVCFRSRFITVRLVKWVVASLGLVTRRTVVVTGRTASSWWLDVMTPWSDWWTCHQDLYSEYSKATPGNAYVLLWITYWVSWRLLTLVLLDQYIYGFNNLCFEPWNMSLKMLELFVIDIK